MYQSVLIGRKGRKGVIVNDFELENWLPMGPMLGPPFPRFLNIFWPWYKTLQPGGNTVKWIKGPTHVEHALSDIIDYVTLFLVVRADGVWIQITTDIWDTWAIPRDQICGIYVDRACAMPEGFVWSLGPPLPRFPFECPTEILGKA